MNFNKSGCGKSMMRGNGSDRDYSRLIVLEAAAAISKRLVLGLAIWTSQFGASDAAEVHMIVPNIPPHFDEQGNGRIGDVIQESLRACGHEVSFTVVPFGRHWKDYVDDNTYDALATAEADQTFPGTATLPFMHLQDGATVLRDSGLEDAVEISRFHDVDITAFPNADKILGIEASVSRFASFNMRASRFDQIRPLFAGRADAVLADGLITAHFIGVLKDRALAGDEPDIDPTQPEAFRRLFQAGPQRLYFRDANIARDFDRCFRALLDSGEVVRIAKHYLDRYRDVLGDQYPDY